MTKTVKSVGLPRLTAELNQVADKYQASILQRFFKTGLGQYGEGDVFLGIKVPVLRNIASRYPELPLGDIAKLLASSYHEFRLVGLFILTRQYEQATSPKTQKEIVDFYLAHTQGINNWDLVDLSVYKILGHYLVTGAKVNNGPALKNIPSAKNIPPILLKLSQSKNLWERRMAMIATFAFLKEGRSAITFVLAAKLLTEKHDLMHKAVGWMLREAGKRVSRQELLTFLNKYSKVMPRTALRYAIEHLPPQQREQYLKK
jgi:3-methyladenine DNA glycosylase AlkD